MQEKIRTVKIGKSKHFNKTFKDVKVGDTFYVDDMPNHKFVCTKTAYKNDDGILTIESENVYEVKEKRIKL